VLRRKLATVVPGVKAATVALELVAREGFPARFC